MVLNSRVSTDRLFLDEASLRVRISLWTTSNLTSQSSPSTVSTHQYLCLAKMISRTLLALMPLAFSLSSGEGLSTYKAPFQAGFITERIPDRYIVTLFPNVSMEEHYVFLGAEIAAKVKDGNLNLREMKDPARNLLEVWYGVTLPADVM